MKVKWGLRSGGVFFKKDTEVKLATLEEARTVFPSIVTNSNSSQISVWLPGMTRPTIVHRTELTE